MHNLFLDGIEIMIKVDCPTKILKKSFKVGFKSIKLLG